MAKKQHRPLSSSLQRMRGAVLTERGLEIQVDLLSLVAEIRRTISWLRCSAIQGFPDHYMWCREKHQHFKQPPSFSRWRLRLDDIYSTRLFAVMTASHTSSGLKSRPGNYPYASVVQGSGVLVTRGRKFSIGKTAGRNDSEPHV